MPRHQPHADEADVLQGTLDLLILKVVALRPIHGYGIVQRLQQISNDALVVRQGSLYPALYRLENRGWIKAGWTTSELGRRVKAYRLTPAGRRQLAKSVAAWQQFAGSVAKVLAEP